jgi:hypothetical protein
VPALEDPLAVGRDEGESGHLRTSERLGDKGGGVLREPPLRVLLPGCDEAACTPVVEHRRPG